MEKLERLEPRYGVDTKGYERPEVVPLGTVQTLVAGTGSPTFSDSNKTCDGNEFEDSANCL